MRWGAVFIAVCMVVIAGSTGVVGYLLFGLPAAAAAGTGFGVLSLLAAYHAFAGRVSGQAQLAHQIAELSRGTADLARQVGELGRRVVAAEAAVAQSVEQARSATAPLTAELDLIGTVVKDLAEVVVGHEAALSAATPASLKAAPPPAAPPRIERAAPPSVPVAAQPVAPDPFDEVFAGLQASPLDAAGDASLTEEIRAAIQEGRVELHLQPIVTLPQRKVRHYEASLRLRLADGVLLAPADYRAAAAAAQLLPTLDDLLLQRVLQVAQRLAGSGRDTAVLADIAGATLVDAAAHARLVERLSAHRALASTLVLGLSQAAWRTIGPIEQEALSQIVSLGFRLMLSEGGDLRIDGRQLAAQGCRFVKTPASALLGHSLATASDIHPSDLASLLARFGIELIADGVQTEGMVVDLLDYDVGLAQGTLLGAPRVVRTEALAGVADPASPVRPAVARPPHQGEGALAQRRREPDPGVQQRTASERHTQGLAQLARNMMRRA